MKILVSGASGFLGSRIVDFFAHKNHKVTSLIRKNSRLDCLIGLNTDIVSVDSSYTLSEIISDIKPDVVFNTVAEYGRKNSSLASVVDSNIRYPAELLDAVVDNNVKVMVHIGTSLPSDVSLYAKTKNSFIDIIKMKDLKESKFVNIEQEYFYGPGEDDNRFISYIIRECLKNAPINLTKGLQVRDFISVDDTLLAYNFILDSLDSLELFTSIEVGSGKGVAIKDIVNTIHRKTNSQSSLNFGAIPDRNSEITGSYANISCLTEMGWEQKTTLSEGIEDMIKFAIGRK